MLLGAVLFATIVGRMSALAAVLNRKSTEHQRVLDNVTEFMVHKEFPKVRVCVWWVMVCKFVVREGRGMHRERQQAAATVNDQSTHCVCTNTLYRNCVNECATFSATSWSTRCVLLCCTCDPLPSLCDRPSLTSCCVSLLQTLYSQEEVLEDLSPGLRRMVLLHLNKELMEHVPFLRHANPGFVRYGVQPPHCYRAMLQVLHCTDLALSLPALPLSLCLSPCPPCPPSLSLPVLPFLPPSLPSLPSPPALPPCPPFHSFMVTKLRPVHVIKEEYVICAGEAGLEMYILKKGAVSTASRSHTCLVRV